MKSLVKIVLFLFVGLFFSACSLIPEKKGEILVVNNSEEDLIYSVYGKLENESSYMLYCVNSNAKEKQDVYFYVEPGKYNLEVVVAKKLTDGLYSQNKFSTPHRQPVVVKEKEVFPEFLNSHINRGVNLLYDEYQLKGNYDKILDFIFELI